MKRGLVLLVVATLGCAEPEPVRIGAVLPLSGEARLYGASIHEGVELAFTEIQASSAASVGIRLSVVDSQSDPERAAELSRQLFEDGVLAIIGGVTSAEALRVVPIAEASDRVLLSPSASSPELSGSSRHFYRVFISDAREGATMATFATQRRKARSAVIFSTMDAYGRGIQEVFTAEFERQGGQVLELVDLAAGSTDLAALAGRAAALRPDAAYVAAYAEATAGLLRALTAADFHGDIYTTSAFATPEVIARVGSEAEGIFLTQAVFEAASDEPRIVDFVARFRALHGAAPDLYAAHGYDAMMVLEAALAADQDGVPDGFWRSVRGLRGFTGVTGVIQFDERGDVQRFPRVYVIDGGTPVDYERKLEVRRRALLARLREIEQQREDER